MADVPLSELLRHVPGIDCDGRLVACCCGWRLKDESEDLWLSWIEHLPGVGAPPKLALSKQDMTFLSACKIKL